MHQEVSEKRARCHSCMHFHDSWCSISFSRLVWQLPFSRHWYSVGSIFFAGSRREGILYPLRISWSLRAFSCALVAWMGIGGQSGLRVDKLDEQVFRPYFIRQRMVSAQFFKTFGRFFCIYAWLIHFCKIWCKVLICVMILDLIFFWHKYHRKPKNYFHLFIMHSFIILNTLFPDFFINVSYMMFSLFVSHWWTLWNHKRNMIGRLAWYSQSQVLQFLG